MSMKTHFWKIVCIPCLSSANIRKRQRAACRFSTKEIKVPGRGRFWDGLRHCNSGGRKSVVATRTLIVRSGRPKSYRWSKWICIRPKKTRSKVMVLWTAIKKCNCCTTNESKIGNQHRSPFWTCLCSTSIKWRILLSILKRNTSQCLWHRQTDSRSILIDILKIDARWIMSSCTRLMGPEHYTVLLFRPYLIYMPRK